MTTYKTMKLTNKIVADLRAKGWSFRRIAKKFGKSVSTIYDRYQRYVANKTPEEIW